MNGHKYAVAKVCLKGAESNSMSSSLIIETLLQEGFESYMVDFRRAIATYYLSSGENIDLPIQKVDTSIAPTLDARLIQTTIKKTQQLLSEYTYQDFYKEAAAAGCAGYIVSLLGRRVIYIGRTAETYIESFPD